MLEKSLFICYSNAHFSELTDIFLVSLKNIGVKNVKHLLHNFNNNFNNNSSTKNMQKSKTDLALEKLMNERNMNIPRPISRQ